MKNISLSMLIVAILLTKFVRAEYKPADTVLEMKLKVNYQGGGYGCYDLRPRDSFIVVISEYAIAELNYCSHSSTTWSFDVNGRISTIVNGLDYCLTAPGSVLSGRVIYDNVRALRCDMGNRAQQWYISKENHITSFIGDYKMEGYHSLIYISSKDAGFYPLFLSDEMKNWKDNLSIPRSYNFSLSMNWRLDNRKYYANYRADSYSAFRSTSDNSYRVLYSPYTKLISFQHLFGANESVAYCLKSNNKQGDKVWQYTEISSYTKCPKVGSELIPEEMQWDMVVVDLPDDQKKQALVQFYDKSGNALKVWRSSGAWGLTFTAPNDSIDYYTSIVQDAEGSFYVNRELAEWGLFDSANQQKRAQYCPAPTVVPHHNFQKHGRERLLPVGFILTEEWYSRLYQIAISPEGQVPGIGICGVCLLQTLEILRELYESNVQMQPTGNGHYFDPTSQVPSMDQFANNEPNIYMALETVWQAVESESNTLLELFRDGYMSQSRYLDEFRVRFINSIRTAVNEMLPDFYQTTPAVFTFTNYTDDFRDSIDNYFSQSSTGTTAIVTTQVALLSGRSSGHSVPLLLLEDGWVLLEVSSEGATQARIDLYNRARFATPSEAIFNYYQTRSPFAINGQNNINFSAIGNTLLVTQVNQRPSVIVRNPAVSFGNCTGEGEDGRRGTGTQTETRDFIQNECGTSHNDFGRCYGISSSSSVDITANWPSEYLHSLSPNGKPTQIQMHNRGAYFATLKVRYKEFSDGVWKDRVKKSSVALGRTASVTIPSHAVEASVEGILRTGIFWKPFRRIFYAKLCRSNNRWYNEAKGRNIIRARVWGTTFNSAWKFERPNATIEMETDSSQLCNW